MINPSKTLKKLFYFINDNVVYNISYYQDSDKCGQEKVIYNEDGTINEAANAGRFPYFIVNYTDKNEPSKTYNVYYWLQDLIKDGDTVVDNQFVRKSHEEENYSYIEFFVNDFKKQIEKLINNGLTLEKIKKNIPFYCFEPDENETKNERTIIINNKKVDVIYKGVNGFEPLSNEALLNEIYAVINAKTISYADNLLSEHKKKLKNTEELKIVTADTVEDKTESE